MHMTFGAAVAAAIFACTVFLHPAKAADGITEREKRDCRADYHKYCSEYGLGTNALRACMSRNIKKISHVCVAAVLSAQKDERIGRWLEKLAGRLGQPKALSAVAHKLGRAFYHMLNTTEAFSVQRFVRH